MNTQIELFYTPHFLKKYAKLDTYIKTEVKEKIKLFQNKTNHKQLKVHKLNAYDNTYSFSVNYKLRIVFEYGTNKHIVHFLYIGSHDEVY